LHILFDFNGLSLGGFLDSFDQVKINIMFDQRLDNTDRGAAHAVQISVVCGAGGFGALKRLADAVCAVALGPLGLSRGRVVSANFLGGRTRRIEGAGLRQIDLRFRLAIEDNV